ncbi:MAG: hypothetical protein IIX84_04470, partial [Oscillospiraceae bacterium]|nr:hypothetical protein [Oscillospiraceae bacterium]
LLLEDDCNFWFESGYTTDIEFKNNRVLACDFGITYPGGAVIRYTPKVMDESSESFVHGKLTVSGNRFEGAWLGNHVFHLEYLREAIIENNSFDAPYAIDSARVVGSVTDRGNTVDGRR